MSDEPGLCDIQLGPVLIDVPRSIGYFGGVGAAVVLGLVDPPLGVFIAAAPFLVMLRHRSLPVPVRLLGETLEGAAKPIGGDDDGYVRVRDGQRESARDRAVAERARRGDGQHPRRARRPVETCSPDPRL